MGIKNPALDELVDKIVSAKNRKDLVTNVQAQDRILTHQYYVVPHWYIAYDRAVYWNKFGKPKINASQAAISNNILEWWWWDKEKAEKLKKARAAGTSVK
jgi:microcin C transport system substrate-binding protein